MGKGFLDEGKEGHKSAMRAMCFIALLSAVFFGSMVVTSEDPSRLGVYTTFGFLIAAFAPKALQKFAEKNIPDSPAPTKD